MLLKELIYKIENDLMIIKFNNHNISKSQLLNELNHTYKVSHQLYKTFENTKEDRKLLDILKKIYFEVDCGKYVNNLRIRCYDCGNSIYVLLKNDNEISLEYHESIVDHTNDMNCLYNTYMKNKKMSNFNEEIINIPTGKLVFKNYFIFDKLNVDDNSVDSKLDQIKLTSEYAKHNIGFAQMSNMHVTVYMNNSHDEIIIGSELDDNDEFIDHIGFKKYGYICLDVWRWMCGDIKILNNLNIKADLTFEATDGCPNKDKTTFKDTIMLNVIKGKWCLKNYFHISNCGDGIYTTLKLIK